MKCKSIAVLIAIATLAPFSAFASSVSISPATAGNCNDAYVTVYGTRSGLAVFNAAGEIVGNDWYYNTTPSGSGYICSTSDTGANTFTGDTTDNTYVAIPTLPSGTYTVVTCDLNCGVFYTGTTTLAEALAVASDSATVTLTGGIGTIKGGTAAAAGGTLGGFVSVALNSIITLVLLALSIPLAFWILREIIALFSYGARSRGRRDRE